MQKQWKTITATLIGMALIFPVGTGAADAQTSGPIGTSAPLSTDSAGIAGGVAINSVFRVLCREKGIFGTGFLHKSGFVITAEHVVDGCKTPEIALPDNKTFLTATIVHTDAAHDLALLKPAKPISGSPLTISAASSMVFGSQIAF